MEISEAVTNVRYGQLAPNCQNVIQHGRSKFKDVSVVVHHLVWQTLVILTDKDANVPTELFTKNRNSLVTQFNLLDPASIDSILDHHSDFNTESNVFLVVCSPYILRHLLLKVNAHDRHYQEQGVLTFLHRWLVVSDSFEMIQNDVVNITHLSVITSKRMNMASKVYAAMWEPYGRRLRVSATVCTNGTVSGEIFPSMKYGLNGRPFLVTTNMWEPFMRKLDGLSGNDRYVGFCAELVAIIADRMNFTYTFVEPADGLWGSTTNGIWSGIIGDLAYKTADMMAAPADIQNDRNYVMDYTFPYYIEEVSILYKHNKNPIENAFLFIQPYSWQVWLCMIALVPLLSIILWKLEILVLHTKLMDYENVGLAESVWSTLGAVVNQGAPKTSSSSAVRTVSIFWMFSCLVYTVTYASNLVALLSVKIESKPFNTLADFAVQNEYKYGFTGGTAFVSKFRDATGIYRTMWDRMVSWEKQGIPSLSTSSAMHFDQVDRGGYAYFVDTTAAVLHMKTSCDYRLFRDNLASSYYALGFQNNSAYTKPASKIIMKLSQSGLFKQWKRQFWPSHVGCQELTSSGQTIKIVDLIGLFGLLVVFLLIASGALGAELLLRERTKGTEKQRHLDIGGGTILEADISQHNED